MPPSHPLGQLGGAGPQGLQPRLGPAGPGGQHRRELRRGRISQTAASPWWVGNTPAKARSAEVELEAVPGHPADVGVEAGAARLVRLPHRRPEQLRHPGADAVGADHQSRGQPPAGAVRPACQDTAHPAVSVPDDVAHRRPGQQRGAGPDRGVGEDRVQDVAPGREHHVDAGLVLDREAERLGRAVAVLLEQDRADGRCAAVEHLVQQPPPGQLDDATADQRVGRVGVARQLRPVHDDHVVAGAGQEHCGRGPGGPGPDDDHVVVGPATAAGQRPHGRSVERTMT